MRLRAPGAIAIIRIIPPVAEEVGWLHKISRSHPGTLKAHLRMTAKVGFFVFLAGFLRELTGDFVLCCGLWGSAGVGEPGVSVKHLHIAAESVQITPAPFIYFVIICNLGQVPYGLHIPGQMKMSVCLSPLSFFQGEGLGERLKTLTPLNPPLSRGEIISQFRFSPSHFFKERGWGRGSF